MSRFCASTSSPEWKRGRRRPEGEAADRHRACDGRRATHEATQATLYSRVLAAARAAGPRDRHSRRDAAASAPRLATPARPLLGALDPPTTRRSAAPGAHRRDAKDRPGRRRQSHSRCSVKRRRSSRSTTGGSIRRRRLGEDGVGASRAAAGSRAARRCHGPAGARATRHSRPAPRSSAAASESTCRSPSWGVALVGDDHAQVARALGRDAGERHDQRVRPVVGGNQHVYSRTCARLHIIHRLRPPSAASRAE